MVQIKFIPFPSLKLKVFELSNCFPSLANVPTYETKENKLEHTPQIQKKTSLRTKLVKETGNM